MATLGSPSPPRRSWGRIALILALILSLLGNAVTLGALVRLQMARSYLLGSEAVPARLPDDLRAELRAALRQDPRQSLPLLREVVRARMAIVEAIRAEPYDRAATEAAADAFRAAIDALITEVQDIFLDRLDQRGED